MKKLFFKSLLAAALLISAQSLVAQNLDSAEKQHSPLIEGNGTSGTAGSNHNPDSKDRQNNGTPVINNLKGSNSSTNTSKDSVKIHHENAKSTRGTKGSMGATSPQNSSSPK